MSAEIASGRSHDIDSFSRRLGTSSHDSARPGAVVIGGDFQGLGIVRSLGRRGVPICIIDDERSIARFSRYTTHMVRIVGLRDEQRAVDSVLAVSQRLGLNGWVLYPTRDETVVAFARHRALLLEHFRVPTPALDVVQWAWDKRNTYRLAEQLAIPTPRTWYPLSRADLDAIDGEFPLVVKPAIKEHFIYATKVKAWRVDTRAQLVDRFEQASKLVGLGEIMIQELIPGDGRQQYAYCALFKNGSALGSMTVGRRRQHPQELGRASTYVETVDLPLLETLSQRFLAAINYYGLAEMEYKLDPRSGEYKLLDVNARTWGYHSLGQHAGVDFPYLLFADQMGEAVEPQRAVPGIKWIRLATDVPTAAVAALRGQLKLRPYLRSLRGLHAESVFCLTDPMPGIAELALLPYLSLKRGL